MTKSELIAQFTDIMKDPQGSLEKAASFLNEVSKDYDNFDTINTTLATANDSIATLTEENKKLKETNLQLFTMFPTSKDTIVNIQDEPQKPKSSEPEYTPEDIAQMLLGNKKGESN